MRYLKTITAAFLTVVLSLPSGICVFAEEAAGETVEETSADVLSAELNGEAKINKLPTGDGSRSNPYRLGETFSVPVYDLSSGQQVMYTFTVKDFLGKAVADWFPLFDLDDRVGVDCSFAVSSEQQDAISMDMTFQLITDNFEEYYAWPYKKDGRLNSIDHVYDGGRYESILMNNDDLDEASIRYLTIEYISDQDWNTSYIWVDLTEETDEPAKSEEQKLQERINELEAENQKLWAELNELGIYSLEDEEGTADDPDSRENPEDGVGTGSGEDPEADGTEITGLDMIPDGELDQVLQTQPLVVEDTAYTVHNETSEKNHSDWFQATVRNQSGSGIQDITVAFAVWDSNGDPVKMKGKYDLSSRSYVVEVNYEDVNMMDGTMYEADADFILYSQCAEIAQIRAIAVSYTDFDGNIWGNSYYQKWKDMYEGRKLELE